jgi:hypothetical protein
VGRGAVPGAQGARRKDCLYRFTFTAPDKEFDRYLPAFQRLAETFR